MNLSDRVRANIAYLLEARGYTYSDLGWPRNYVGDVIHGRRGLSTARIDEFAARLGVDVAEICQPVRKAMRSCDYTPKLHGTTERQ